ncbi:MAG: hypothetical protein QXJ75_05335 [Candidatus Bathyarchaeia archaeon]
MRSHKVICPSCGYEFKIQHYTLAQRSQNNHRRLSEQCTIIMQYLSRHKEGLQKRHLKRILNDRGISISSRALSSHLNELLALRLIAVKATIEANGSKMPRWAILWLITPKGCRVLHRREQACALSQASQYR